jgi:hypothetical protein
MLRPESRRKLLYPLGLMGFLILPFIYFHSFYDYLNYHDNTVNYEVIYWHPSDTAHSPLKYVNEKFMKINLTGSDEDKIKLEFAEIAIRELIHQPDTTIGIEFTFKDGAKFSSLIKLLEICEQEGVRAYVNHNDKFWVFNLRPI